MNVTRTPADASAITVAPANRLYKARIFEMVFSEKKELLELYNAMNHTNYQDPEQLEINTKNNLYGTRAIQIPSPRFVIFYNGNEEQPDSQTLRLSDSFTIQDEVPSLQLSATMININLGHNPRLLDACKTLKDYSEYTDHVRRYAKDMELEQAVNRAIDECIREGILAEFLSKNKAEAIKMSIYEYDEAKHMQQEREQHFEDGFQAGIEKGLQEGKIKGLQEGESRFAVLTQQLLKKQRYEDLQKATEDTEYRSKLYSELGI